MSNPADRLTRSQRRDILTRARCAARAGEHDYARDLFASVGISYVTPGVRS